MQSIEKMLGDGSFDSITKKERLTLSRDKEKMEKVLGGIAQLSRVPAALFIVDIGHEHIALAEAKRLGVGTFGVVDTNCDPNKVDFAIPANDDATKSIAIITQYITAAIAEDWLNARRRKMRKQMMHLFQMRIKRRLQEWKQKHKLKQVVVVNLVVGGQPRRRTPSSPKRTSNR
jgi:small subunit ribosomal protein S2